MRLMAEELTSFYGAKTSGTRANIRNFLTRTLTRLSFTQTKMDDCFQCFGSMQLHSSAE